MEKIGFEFDTENISNAIELARLGAKPRVIAALTRIKASQASKLFAEVHGRSASSGQFVDSFHRFVRTRVQHFQSNFLFNMFTQLRCLGLSDAQIIIQSYRAYTERFGSSQLYDCSEVFALWVQLKHPDLTVTVCTDCETRYFLAPLELAIHPETCPLCRLEKKFLESTHAAPKSAAVA